MSSGFVNFPSQLGRSSTSTPINEARKKSGKERKNSARKLNNGNRGKQFLDVDNRNSDPEPLDKSMNKSPHLSPVMQHKMKPGYSPILARSMARLESPFGSPKLSRANSTTDSLTTDHSDIGGMSFDEHGAGSSSPAGSQSSFNYSADSIKRRYKSELWSAIKSNYRYLMDDEIIETCKSTESDISVESDGAISQSDTVSYKEFIEQYVQLSGWLTETIRDTPTRGRCKAEYYLNKIRYQLLLERAPSRQAFNESARALIGQHPQLSSEIKSRLSRLNSQWEELAKLISPNNDSVDPSRVVEELEKDTVELTRWVNKTEGGLKDIKVTGDWTENDLKDKLAELKIYHTDIEQHSKTFSAMLDFAQIYGTTHREAMVDLDIERDVKMLVGLQKRCHALWLLVMEWQMRLEDMINNGIPLREECDEDQWDLQMTTTGSYLNDRDRSSWPDTQSSSYQLVNNSCGYRGNKTDGESSGSSEYVGDSASQIGRSDAINIGVSSRRDVDYDADSALGRRDRKSVV